MQELRDGVRARIPIGRIIPSIYSTLSTPPSNRQKPADIERVTTDTYLANQVAVTEVA